MANPLYDDPRYKYDQPHLLYDGGWRTSGAVACRVGGRGGTAARKGESQAVALRTQERAALAAAHRGLTTLRLAGQGRAATLARRAALGAVRATVRPRAQVGARRGGLGLLVLGGTAALLTPAWLTSRQVSLVLRGFAGGTTDSGGKVIFSFAALRTRGWSTGSALAVGAPPPTLLPLDPLEIIDLGHVYRGDTLILPLWQARDQRGNLLDLTDALIWFTAKQALADPDLEPPTIQVSTADGWVTVLDAEAAIYRVVVPPHETQGLLADTYFTFDVQAQWDAPVIRTIRRGVLVVMCDVTRAMA